MKTVRRILVVLDPALLRTPALDRAVALARTLRAELWLALYDRGPRLGLLGLGDRDEAHRLEAMMREQESTRLEELRQSLAEDGTLQVRCIDAPDRASAARILDDIAKHRIDLLIKDVGHESSLRRLVFLPLDWELLRRSPVPVWMVGAGASGMPKRIIAAVDPVHPEHGAGALNDAILDTALGLQELAKGNVRVFSAFTGLPPGLQGMDPIGLSLGTSFEDLYEQMRVDHRAALDTLLARHRLGTDHAVVLYGPAAYSVLDALEGFQPELLVVGNVRRRGLDRLLMGSTVERLIGEAPCDILAVPATVSVHPAIPREASKSARVDDRQHSISE